MITQNRPLKYLSELGIEVIRMALNNAFNDKLWQACGFDKVPQTQRGAIFNIFVSSEKLAKETFLIREFIIAPIGIFVRELRKRIYFPETPVAHFLAHYLELNIFLENYCLFFELLIEDIYLSFYFLFHFFFFLFYF